MQGRHRPGRRRGTLPVVAAAAAVLAVLAGSWGGYRLLSQPSCADRIQLSVAAATEIAPAVQASAAQWTATSPRVAGKCVAVEVVAADPADVAAAIAGQNRSTLNGVGQASGKVKVPDVWIPDSTIWLQRLRAVGRDWVPDDAPSVGNSPVVLAMPEPAAATLGWPAKNPTWAELLPRFTSDGKLRAGIVDPYRDSPGLSGLLALAVTANAVGGPAGQQATLKALRSLATGGSVLRGDLLARFPRSTDLASLASGLSAAPLSEQAVISYNGAQPPVPLASLYVDPSPAPLDYPFAVLPGADANQEDTARALKVTLAGDAYRDRLAEAGLRAADGGAGSRFAAPKGAPAVPSPGLPVADPAIIDKVLSTWTAATSPGRFLAVIDVSGSMLQPVPSAGNATRSQVTIEAARRGLALLDDRWAVGLWVFSTQLEGAIDHRELVPIGQLSDRRQALLSELAAVRPKPNGGTGLFDTTLAAYKTVQADWDPGRVNGVVIMTDGKNEDQRGISLDRLVEELNRTMDPTRPIQVIVLGIGDGVSESELRRITETAGGGTFIARDPGQVGELLLKALALRTNVKR